MKTILYSMAFLLLNTLVTAVCHAQTVTGVNTKTTPALPNLNVNTLDVNNTMGIRILSVKGYPNANTVLVTDAPIAYRPNNLNSQGSVIYKASAKDVLFSSGVYAKEDSPNRWTGLKQGASARFTFVGEFLRNTGGIEFRFTFTVFSDQLSGDITLMDNFSACTPGIMSITKIGVRVFNVTVGGQVFTFTMTDNVVNGRYRDFTVTNANGYVLTGTFISSYDYR